MFLIALITEKKAEFTEALRMFPRTRIHAHKVWFNSSLLFAILLHYYILIFYYIPRKDLIPRSWHNNNSLSACSINPIGSVKSLRPQCMGQQPSFVCGWAGQLTAFREKQKFLCKQWCTNYTVLRGYYEVHLAFHFKYEIRLY